MSQARTKHAVRPERSPRRHHADTAERVQGRNRRVEPIVEEVEHILNFAGQCVLHSTHGSVHLEHGQQVDPNLTAKHQGGFRLECHADLSRQRASILCSHRDDADENGEQCRHDDRHATKIHGDSFECAWTPCRRARLTVDEMARQAGVGKRTIERDMVALQEAGFPLTSEKGADLRTRWMLMSLPLKALHNPGLSVVEVCSLYMSRALLAAMPGAAFADGLAGLVKKIERSLSPALRAFLDELPGVVKVEPGAVKKHQKDYGEIVARLIDATTNHRIARMRYFSASNNREEEYVVHPQHVAYFDGGLYLTARVPEYGQPRNFAVERIRSLIVTEKPFTPAEILEQLEEARDGYAPRLAFEMPRVFMGQQPQLPLR